MTTKRTVLGLLGLSVFAFICFGGYHLAKFETVDEVFWKYDRIPQYWRGWERGLLSRDTFGSFERTRINDKPGVTVGLFAGPGLLLDPRPQDARVPDDQVEGGGKRYVQYDSDRVLRLNAYLRWPSLGAVALTLILHFWLLLRIFSATLGGRDAGQEEHDQRAWWLALLGTAGLAFSPVLVGISQILNPDAFLWTFMSASMLGFWAWLATGERRFVWITGILTGFALLSKYTANLLFLFYPVAAALFLLFQAKRSETGDILRFFKDAAFALAALALTALATFGLLMPAVLNRPKHFGTGTWASPAGVTWYALLFALLWMVFELRFGRGRSTAWLLEQTKHFGPWLLRVLAGLILFVSLVVLGNAWTGERFIPMENIKELAYVDGELTFPMYRDVSLVERLFKTTIIQAYPLVFSLPPAVGLVLFAAYAMLLFGWRPKHFSAHFTLLMLAPVVYIAGALSSGILLNYRYAIVLFPFDAYFIAFFAAELWLMYLASPSARAGVRRWFGAGATALVATCGLIALFTSAPHYFTYTNPLLAKEFSIADSWGYGSYEAAAYLNSLPDAERLVIWSDRSAVCQFIKGRCLKGKSVSPEHLPDYFVLTRRGVLTNRFRWSDPALAPYDREVVYAPASMDHPEWEIHIGGRPDNFVKVIKAPK